MNHSVFRGQRSAPIERASLGLIRKIGKGGEGVVYLAPSIKLSHAEGAVFKEYRPEIVGNFDSSVLQGMTDYLSTLGGADGERLIGHAAWPCRVVESAGEPVGFVMPAVPKKFHVDWRMPSGKTDRVLAEFQHLLNGNSFLAKRGISMTDKQRVQLLLATAEALDHLHEHDVVVGDFSPKNTLFSLDGRQAAAYFIDCDAFRFQGSSVTKQLETPGWEIPRGEELATTEADVYKLALLTLRLLAGHQTSIDVADLPGFVPKQLRSLLKETLGSRASARPPIAEFQGALSDTERRAPKTVSQPAPPRVFGAGGAPSPVAATVQRPPPTNARRPSTIATPQAPPSPVAPQANSGENANLGARVAAVPFNWIVATASFVVVLGLKHLNSDQYSRHLTDRILTIGLTRIAPLLLIVAVLTSFVTPRRRAPFGLAIPLAAGALFALGDPEGFVDVDPFWSQEWDVSVNRWFDSTLGQLDDGVLVWWTTAGSVLCIIAGGLLGSRLLAARSSWSVPKLWAGGVVALFAGLVVVGALVPSADPAQATPLAPPPESSVAPAILEQRHFAFLSSVRMSEISRADAESFAAVANDIFTQVAGTDWHLGIRLSDGVEAGIPSEWVVHYGDWFESPAEAEEACAVYRRAQPDSLCRVLSAEVAVSG